MAKSLDKNSTSSPVTLWEETIPQLITDWTVHASTPFAGGKTCKAGLLNLKPFDATQTSCDDHPTQSGHQLLADTVEAAYKAASPGHLAFGE